MTKAELVRVTGMSIFSDDATAKMIEFRETVEDRQLAVISSQASEIMRGERRILQLEKKITIYQLVLAAVTVVALLLLADDLGWL